MLHLVSSPAVSASTTAAAAFSEFDSSVASEAFLQAATVAHLEGQRVSVRCQHDLTGPKPSHLATLYEASIEDLAETL